MKITCSMCTAKRMIPRGSHSTQFERFLIVSTKTGKKSLKIIVGRRPAMTFEQHERAIGMLTTGMSARDVAWHFQRHESTISRLLNRFQQTRNIAHRSRSGRPRKTTPREGRFLTSSQRNRFLSSQKLDRLLRNATGTRVCDRTVRNRLHAARLKACSPYVGIPLKQDAIGRRFIRAGLAGNVFGRSRFNVSFADGRVRTWKRRGERLD